MKYKMCDEKVNKEYYDALVEICGNHRENEYSGDFKYICAIDKENKIAGYIKFDENNNEYIICEIYIIDEERYKSYGKNLVKSLINIALSQNMECISCNQKFLFGFFKKLGFVYHKKESKMILKDIQKRLMRKKMSKRILIFSIFQNMFLAIIKIVGGKLGNSNGLISDGINSMSDIATSCGILISMLFSGKPADAEHPYGHEKIESIISIILGIIIVVTGFELGRWTIVKFINKEYLNTTPDVKLITIAFVSMIVKYSMYRNKLKIGIRTDNIALISDAKDSKSDVYVSASVILGILLSIYINPIFDIILSLIVSIMVMKEGISALLTTTHVILETQDKEFIRSVEDYIYSNTDITNVHDMIMKKSGANIFLTMDIRLPGEMTLYESHKVSDDLKKDLLSSFKNLSDVRVHVDYLMDKKY
ncbi:cation diffusion facilitator family transporter [Fusobacterium sp. PH5-44]|uniref:cation diffusion facilitator family transporter n=1 Tax=unclassified Fusobacterium TaxID=2648384 RepID=UPI003D1DC9F5